MWAVAKHSGGYSDIFMLLFGPFFFNYSASLEWEGGSARALLPVEGNIHQGSLNGNVVGQSPHQ